MTQTLSIGTIHPMKHYYSTLFLFALLIFPYQVWGAEKTSEMVKIPAGCFLMGTNKTYLYEDDNINSREKPAHKVCLDSFYMDPYEVTQEKWDAVMNFNRSVFHKPNQPMTHITWREARSYCKRVGKRLPTEAEWEYSARAGTQTRFYWGDEVDGDYLWYADNSSREPANVGTKKPNAWGLYDMVGSVWEWVEDWYSIHYYENSPTKNPLGPDRTSFRIIRGNSWITDEKYLRVTIRHGGLSDPTLTYWVGVRCAMSPANH